MTYFLSGVAALEAGYRCDKSMHDDDMIGHAEQICGGQDLMQLGQIILGLQTLLDYAEANPDASLRKLEGNLSSLRHALNALATPDEIHDYRLIQTETNAECQNCDWVGPESELHEIRHIGQRVEPGEVMPAGECPKCGALAHLLED